MNPPSKKNTCNLSLSLSRSFAHPQREHPPWSCLAFFFFFFLRPWLYPPLKCFHVNLHKKSLASMCFLHAIDPPPNQSMRSTQASKLSCGRSGIPSLGPRSQVSWLQREMTCQNHVLRITLFLVHPRFMTFCDYGSGQLSSDKMSHYATMITLYF